MTKINKSKRSTPVERDPIGLSTLMTDNLQSLIRSGKLAAGTTLHHEGRQHPSRTVTATVTEDGIRFKGRIYLSPSAAARAVTSQPVDGWLFWKLPSGKALDTLRTHG